MGNNKNIIKPKNNRKIIAWISGILGLISYNWWILAPFKSGIITSPNQLFSDLEINGQPYANVMQHLDLISGILFLITFLFLINRSNIKRNYESLALIGFGIFAALGGVFSETCSDTTNAVCRHLEISMKLPAQQYLHLLFGIAEFGFITIALFFAYYRTKKKRTKIAKIYRFLFVGAFIAYPLLGLAYVTNRLGAIIEPVFFTAFSIIILVQLYERTKEA
jgi:hypothetical protein